MALGRSPEISERIHTIRNDIRRALNEDINNVSTDDRVEISKQRELAQRFRTELMLETAQLAQTIFKSIYDNPRITVEELEEVAR